MDSWRYRRFPVSRASYQNVSSGKRDPEPVSSPATCSSEYSDVWMEVMRMDFDEFVAAGIFA